MANIFSNLGPGLAKAAGEQATWSKIVNGQAGHFNSEQRQRNLGLKKGMKKQGVDFENESKLSSVKNNIKEYMTAQDLNYEDTVNLRNKARVARGAMATAAVGTAVLAPRYLSGGNATTNRNGERDIAGIPFI